jgi:hypothetical protein
MRTSGDFPHRGWLVPHADEERGRMMSDVFRKADAFLLGRASYDIFSEY